MAQPCAPPVPQLPGFPAPPQFQQLPIVPPTLVDVGNIVLTEPPGAPTAPQVVPPPAAPRFVSDLPLSNPWVIAWLATLCRATYSPTGDLFYRTARAVNSNFGTQYVANNNTSLPGYGIIHMPRGQIVVVSGTTNPGQWYQQIMESQPVEWTKVEPFGVTGGLSTAGIWKAAATSIATGMGSTQKSEGTLFVGHSMGGAVASLLHGLLPQTENGWAPSRLVTFASPKPGDSRLTRLSRTGAQVYLRLWISGDLVPSLPPDMTGLNLVIPSLLRPYTDGWATYQHAALGRRLDERGDWASNPDEDESLILQLTAALVAAGAGNPLQIASVHSMSNYVSRLLLNCTTTWGAVPNNWSNVWDIAAVNGTLTAAGL